MARTLNPAAHAVRRDAFLDAAQTLIESKGYEQMSVQDILEAVDASRGAFYHYFESKGALLQALVERLVQAATAAVEPVVDDPALTALEKFTRVFSGIARWKTDRRQLMLALLGVWYSDDNALVRDKLRLQMVSRLAPLVARIIEEGRAGGLFSAGAGDETAPVLLTLVYGAGETAGELFFARQANRVTFEGVKDRLAAYATAMERILGVQPGALTILDDATLRAWFDQEST